MVQLLIVDDEPLVQIGIRSMLNWESMGIEIAGTATNGRQAYDIILEKHPEIVITDIKMPIMDGMQLIKKCQSQEHPPLFILLTSYEEFALVTENAEAIRKYIAAGGIFAICTGRMMTSILPHAESLRLDSLLVGYQGALILDLKSGKYLRDEHMSVR